MADDWNQLANRIALGRSPRGGFAIPINIAKRIIAQLVRNGAVRANLGIDTRDVAAFGRKLLPVSDGS
jgi:S1-C subfamily serine protease